jgi:hypothetical protein
MKPEIPFLYDYVFANMIVPNAVSSEMAIINYIFTQYNPGHQYYSVFDKDKGQPNNTVKKIFGNHYMDWPPCMRDHGPHIASLPYHEHMTPVEDSLYFGKKKYKRYIYPILIGPHFRLFAGYGLAGDKINGEYFWKNMSAEALDDAQQGHAFIFLDWAHECLLTKEIYEKLHESIEMSRIPPRNIIFAHNSFNAKEIYESWFAPEERKMQVMNWPFLMFMISHHYATHSYVHVSEKDFLSGKNKERDFYFLLKNRRGHPHRAYVLYSLFEKNLLDKGNWSMLESIDFMRLAGNMTFVGLPFDRERLGYLHGLFPKQLRGEKDSFFENVEGWSDISPSASTSSYFEVTTETLFHTPYLSMTEKISKPLINFLPTIVVGPPGILKRLRELGFKTFDPYINEAYDAEEDPQTRLRMITEEISRLCSFTKEEIHRWYWSMEDILVHNHRKMLEFHTNDPANISLINYLYNCIK